MGSMIQFLKKHPQYYSFYLLGAFFLFAIMWFSVEGPSVQQKASNASLSSSISSKSFNQFSPNASNVTRSASNQLESLELQVEATPDDTMHTIQLARMLRSAHQVNKATIYYEQYLALRPANRQAWLDFAQSLGELNQWQEAKKATEAMLAHYPSDPTGLYNLGAIYANQARIDEARQIWNQVASKSKDSSTAEMAATSLKRLNSFLKP